MTQTVKADVKIERASWAQHQTALQNLRREVFIEEQKVPEDCEWDGKDQAATHFIAIDETNRVLGAVRLLPNGKITRMAVLKPFRNRGVGALLLAKCLQHAQESGLNHVMLDAQVGAKKFYQVHGFTAQGETFLDAGIEHIRMLKHL